MKTTNSKLQISKITWIVVLVLLLSGSKMFSQTVTQSELPTESLEVTVLVADNSSAEATMNIVSWFMGSKQTPKATISNDGPVSAKKQMINAGIAPNRLLVKAFGKKAANFQSTIA